MAKKKTLPKTLKQKAVSLFKNEKEEYAYYLISLSKIFSFTAIIG